MYDNIKQPGIYLQSGPPIHLIAAVATQNEGEIALHRHVLTLDQAAGLGMALLALCAGQEEQVKTMLAQQQAEAVKQSDADFVRQVGVSLQ